MFKGIKDKVKSLTEQIDVSEKLSNAKNLALENINASTSKAVAIFEHYRPEIERILIDGLLTVAEEKLQDETVLQQIFEKCYEILPTPVKLVLSRTTFIEFSMREKEPLLLKVKEYKYNRINPNNT